MKSIELKVFKENINGRETFLTTWDLLKSAVNAPSQSGHNIDEMMKRLRLLEKLDAHKALFEIKPDDFDDSKLERIAVLELEDADFSKLKDLVGEMKWGVVSKSIVEIHNELK